MKPFDKLKKLDEDDENSCYFYYLKEDEFEISAKEFAFRYLKEYGIEISMEENENNIMKNIKEKIKIKKK